MRLEDVYRILDSIVPDERGCHIWPRGKGGGYGQMRVAGWMQKVSRLALERKLGRPIKFGFYACHSCGCKLCVNVDHLFEDTWHKSHACRENMRKPGKSKLGTIASVKARAERKVNRGV